jgi:hypothetical protein
MVRTCSLHVGGNVGVVVAVRETTTTHTVTFPVVFRAQTVIFAFHERNMGPKSEKREYALNCVLNAHANVGYHPADGLRFGPIASKRHILCRAQHRPLQHAAHVAIMARRPCGDHGTKARTRHPPSRPYVHAQ